MKERKLFKKSLIVIAAMAVMLFAMTITASAAQVTGVKQTDDSTSSVEVTWTSELGYTYAVAVSESKTSGYQYVSSYTSSSNTKYISGLTAGKKYYVIVQKFYNNELKGQSDPIDVVTRPNYVESSSIKQTAGSATAIALKWTAVAGATGYKVTKTGGGSKLTSTNSIKIGAKAGNKYSVEISAYKKSSAGYVAMSGKAYKSSLYSAPAAPINYAEASKGNLDWKPTKSSHFKLYWSYNPNYYIPDGYQLEIYSLSGKKLGSATTTSRYREITSSKICTAVKNRGFKTRIRSYKKNDSATIYSKWSATKVIIPQAAIKLTATSSTSCKVTWPKVANATKYIIYVSRDSGVSDSGNWAKKELSASTLSYSITGLKKFKDFGVYVIPVVKVGTKSYKAAKSWYTYSYIY